MVAERYYWYRRQRGEEGWSLKGEYLIEKGGEIDVGHYFKEKRTVNSSVEMISTRTDLFFYFWNKKRATSTLFTNSPIHRIWSFNSHPTHTFSIQQSQSPHYTHYQHQINDIAVNIISTSCSGLPSIHPSFLHNTTTLQSLAITTIHKY